MPVTPTYPGVYIEELPSGVRTITGVATSIAAFIDRFGRGPLDNTIGIHSYADFEREFGGLNATSEASYAIQQFFLNGGSDAFVVRVGRDDTPGGHPLAAATATLGPVASLVATAGRRIRGILEEDPGAWGNNIRIDVDYDTRWPGESVDPARHQTTVELFNLAIAETAPRNGRTVVVRTETYTNLTLRQGAQNNALEVVNEQSKLVFLTTLAADLVPTNRPSTTGTLGAVLPAFVAPADGSTFNITVDVDGTGAVFVTRTATLDYGGTAPTSYPQLGSLVEQAIRHAPPGTGEPLAARDLFSGAAVRLLDERDRDGVMTGQRFRVLLGRAGPGYDPRATVTITAAPAPLDTLVGLAASVATQQFALGNGSDGAALTATQLQGSEAAKTGLYALDDVDLFNILCLPAAAGLADDQMRAVYGEAESYCQRRRAFLIVDLSCDADDLEGVQQWLSDNEVLRHRNAAVYFPRLEILDPLNMNRPRVVGGSSGIMAGLYAATDAARGVWKAPAGTDVRLRGVERLEFVLTDRENGVLNQVGINCFRNLPIYGNVCWGARTLEGADQMASEWKYVPVRRLALFLEESLYRGTKWVVFEPNDEPLWSQIRLNIGSFMHSLFRQGAFQGTTPKDAYFVKCDKETTTQNDINLGIVNILVGFAPLKPAEFVIIKVQQMAGQIQV
jgi:hypothetical protein